MVKQKTLFISLMVVVCLTASCATEEPPEQVFKGLVEPFVFDSLALTPIAATAAGYYEHVRGGQGSAAEGEKQEDATITPLVEMLDDYSPEGVAKRTQFYKDFRQELHGAVDRERLRGDVWADYAAVDDHIDRVLFELEKEKAHEHNPTLYVELVGSALYTPLVHEYGPATERYRHIIARLEKVPAFLEQAKKNLKSSPAIWTEVAAQENEGNIKLVRDVIPAGLPQELKRDYGQASQAALEALEGFSSYLNNELAKQTGHDWRLGRPLYTEKLKTRLTTDKSPDEILQAAEAEFEKTRAQMVEVAKPLHREIYGNQRPPSDEALLKDVFDVVNDDHRLRRAGDLLDQIKKDIAEVQTGVAEAAIVNLPAVKNLQVVETPEFMRGIYSVAGFMPAPPLQPQLGAYYWVTPIPPDWPRARTNSKLRELNLFKLELLTIHEVMPGHYVQTEFSNQGHEELWNGGRVLRSVYPNGSYVEGWAVYITDALVAAGYKSDSGEFQITWLKDKLRVLANAILDIRVHAMDMSEEEAAEFLRMRAFQEAEEVRGKIQRLKLSSAQLPLYYHGWQEWLRVREHYQTETQDFSLTSFHEKALRAGPVPADELGYLTARRPMEDN
jgi:uncharacterized protein (DUF885 family)